MWGLLSPSRPLRFENGSLVVEVQSAFHQETMAVRAHADVLADAVHAALGVRPALMFEARGQNPPTAAEAPANDAAPAEGLSELVDAQPLHEVNDPVELLKKGLGAEVVEERTDR